MHPLLRMYEGVSHKGAALKCETFSAQSAQSSEKVLKCFLGICYNKKSLQDAEKRIERAAASWRHAKLRDTDLKGPVHT